MVLHNRHKVLHNRTMELRSHRKVLRSHKLVRSNLSCHSPSYLAGCSLSTRNHRLARSSYRHIRCHIHHKVLRSHRLVLHIRKLVRSNLFCHSPSYLTSCSLSTRNHKLAHSSYRRIRHIRHHKVLRSHRLALHNKKVCRNTRCHSCCYSSRRYRAYDPKGRTHSFGCKHSNLVPGS